jgi:hypothetical protein
MFLRGTCINIFQLACNPTDEHFLLAQAVAITAFLGLLSVTVGQVALAPV